MIIKVAMGESYKGLCRPTDLGVSRGNPAKARARFGWVAKHQTADIVMLMIEAKKNQSQISRKWV